MSSSSQTESAPLKFFTLAKAAEMSPHEMIFLSDVSGDDRIFSVEDVPPFSLGEVLSISERSDEFFLEVRSNDGIYEVVAFGRHKFAVYEPDTIAAKNLCVGDRVLLRGKHSLPNPFSANASPMSCVSEVLEIVESTNSVLEVRFGLSRPLSTKLFFGSVQLPFGSRPKEEIRMFLPTAAQVEISHESYA
jgi:hypothetical protein